MKRSEKLAATKTAIALLVESSGPVTMADIFRECRIQAYPGFIPLALRDLLNSGFIKISDEPSEKDVFELA